MKTEYLIKKIMSVIRREIGKEYYFFPDYLIQNLAGAIMCEFEAELERRVER